jgi:hypothetical protein
MSSIVDINRIIGCAFTYVEILTKDHHHPRISVRVTHKFGNKLFMAIKNLWYVRVYARYVCIACCSRRYASGTHTHVPNSLLLDVENVMLITFRSNIFNLNVCFDVRSVLVVRREEDQMRIGVRGGAGN